MQSVVAKPQTFKADRLTTMSINTWSDGTTKSQHNAFSIAPRTPVKPTRYQLDYQRRKTAAQRTAEVLRENKNQFTPESQASRDRTAAIANKSLPLGRNQ